MPNYDDPNIFKIITQMQFDALLDVGYMVVPEKEVRNVVLYDEWKDNLFESAIDLLETAKSMHPNSAGIYYL
jgi:uncharacterized protein YutE (UPF0331/DUF86 family)